MERFGIIYSDGTKAALVDHASESDARKVAALLQATPCRITTRYIAEKEMWVGPDAGDTETAYNVPVHTYTALVSP